ncbi:metabotropic glutamate receptor 2-like [Dendronephthya gigantea]|uniref:metabotropic glutamate receptor 2-like n=1 Tax=Dendronephthya gigantea TaxID=151771 RepID=UPI001069D4C5|nr:metabotropic glutamate receptor 2-like [Dendronephthya gigantea]
MKSPGDIILGGLFPVHKEGSREDTCGQFNEIPGYQYMEAMLHAVDLINNRTDILPGIRLGTIIFDTCRSPTITADHTRDFIRISLERGVANASEFAGVIGPFTSGNSIMVANFLRVFEIPQISYGGLTVELSDKSRYGYFFRTVPPDSFFAEGLARFLEHFRWTYVSIIYSTGTYPETGTEEVIKALSKRQICLAERHRLPRFPTSEDFDRAITTVVSAEESNVVVFVTIQRDSRGLLMAKQRSPLAKRLAIVASVSWSNRDDITKGVGPAAEGATTFGHFGGRNTEFEKYFRSFNLSNYKGNYRGWFEEFWESRFECSLRNTSVYTTKCTGREDLTSHQMEIAPVRVVINAVYAMAYALENMRKSLCPNASGICERMKPISRRLLKKFLENVTFPDSCFNWPIRFNQNNEVSGNYTIFNFRESKPGVYSYIHVGNWTSELQENGEISGILDLDTSRIRWPNGETVPSSACSDECGHGNVKRPRSGVPEMCCWDCVTCHKYDIIVNNTCRACAEGYAPDANISSCLKLKVDYITLRKPLAAFLAFLAFLGMTTNLIALVVFSLKRNHRLIRATNIEVCCFIFCGIFLIFITAITFLSKPTQGLCYVQRFLLANSFTVCYAALLVKVRRMYNLSNSENGLPRERVSTHFRALKPHLVITIAIILVEVFLAVLITKRSEPELRENFHHKTGEVRLECQLNTFAFVAYIAGALVLISLCTYYAFRSRNIRKNFRETLYICATAFTSNALWLILLVSYLNTDDSFSRQYLIAGISVLIGWFTLLGLFAPVFYNLRTKRVYDESLLFDWDGPGSATRLHAKQTGQSESSLNNTPTLCERRL